jgi:hypothetical protein
MKCPQCVKEGKRSVVTVGGRFTTAMWSTPFYDEDGKRHNHDRNVITTKYRCSNGHQWSADTRPTCWCGWPDKQEETE